MTKILNSKSYADWSKGNWQGASEFLVPENSAKLALNLNSEEEFGNLISRKGSEIITGQFIDNAPALGLHNYREALGTVNKLFAVFSDGTNNDIYDAVLGTKSLQDDTKDLRTRFLTYLNCCLRLNGTDNPKYFNGTAWVAAASKTFTVVYTTDVFTCIGHGLADRDAIRLQCDTPTTTYFPYLPYASTANLDGYTKYYVDKIDNDTFYLCRNYSDITSGIHIDISNNGSGPLRFFMWDQFDLPNFPAGAKYVIEFHDRVLVAGSTLNPDRIDISSIANSVTKSVSWTNDNKYIVVEQEDGGGGITGFAKVPGYVLIFKRRTMKRYDGVSTFPDDLVNQGAPTQESIVTAQGKAFWVNENGAWVSEGGAPKKISSFTVDNIIKSCSDTDLLKVGAGTDEEHVLFSFPSVTMDGEVYANIALKYNIIQNTWDIRQYPSQHPFYTSYVDTNKTNYLVAGDNDGSVFIIDKGTTDNGTPISYSLETHDLYFGFRLFLKDISRVGFITSGTSKAEVMWRNSNNADDWKQLGTITSDEHLFQNLSLKGSRYNFKITETTDSGRVTIKSIEFPEGIKVFDNTK